MAGYDRDCRIYKLIKMINQTNVITYFILFYTEGFNKKIFYLEIFLSIKKNEIARK